MALPQAAEKIKTRLQDAAAHGCGIFAMAVLRFPPVLLFCRITEAIRFAHGARHAQTITKTPARGNRRRCEGVAGNS